MMRIFVGLPLPAATAERLSGLAGGVPGARWVDPSNYHITLRFIGEMNEGAASDVDEALAEVRAPAFPVHLEGVGQFTTGNRPRALWAGVVGGEPLHRLRASVDHAVNRAGLGLEQRKFTPHVTLARLKEPHIHKVGQFLQVNGLFRDTPWTVDSFTLFESVLSRNGASYHPLRVYSLGHEAEAPGS